MSRHPALPVLCAALLLATAAACGSDSPVGDDAAASVDLAMAHDGSSAVDARLPADLAVVLDQSVPRDLALPEDLATPADLAQRPPDQTMVTDDGGDQVCAAAGAAPGMALCCLATQDYPNQCKIGGCSCAPGNSHLVKICICPMGKCFNGVACQ